MSPERTSSTNHALSRSLNLVEESTSLLKRVRNSLEQTYTYYRVQSKNPTSLLDNLNRVPNSEEIGQRSIDNLLSQAVIELLSGRKVIFGVHGSAGVGKTNLASQLLVRLEEGLPSFLHKVPSIAFIPSESVLDLCKKRDKIDSQTRHGQYSPEDYDIASDVTEKGIVYALAHNDIILYDTPGITQIEIYNPNLHRNEMLGRNRGTSVIKNLVNRFNTQRASEARYITIALTSGKEKFNASQKIREELAIALDFQTQESVLQSMGILLNLSTKVDEKLALPGADPEGTRKINADLNSILFILTTSGIIDPLIPKEFSSVITSPQVFEALLDWRGRVIGESYYPYFFRHFLQMRDYRYLFLGNNNQINAVDFYIENIQKYNFITRLSQEEQEALFFAA